MIHLFSFGLISFSLLPFFFFLFSADSLPTLCAMAWLRPQKDKRSCQNVKIDLLAHSVIAPNEAITL
jgi:hypothetical protein